MSWWCPAERRILGGVPVPLHCNVHHPRPDESASHLCLVEDTVSICQDIYLQLSRNCNGSDQGKCMSCDSCRATVTESFWGRVMDREEKIILFIFLILFFFKWNSFSTFLQRLSIIKKSDLTISVTIFILIRNQIFPFKLFRPKRPLCFHIKASRLCRQIR